MLNRANDLSDRSEMVSYTEPETLRHGFQSD